MFLVHASQNGNHQGIPSDWGGWREAAATCILPQTSFENSVRILVVQLKRLGDLVLTTPVFSALRKTYPEAKIILAAAGNSTGLVPILDVDQTLYFGAGRGDWSTLLRGKFDVCIDLTGNDRSLMVSALSRAKRRITYARFSKKFLRQWIYTDFVDSDVARRHTADHHTDLLRSLGIEVENIPSHVKLTEPRSAKVPARYAVIHAGTARTEKYWEAGNWAKVADWIALEKGLPVFLTGGVAMEEQSHLRKICELTESSPTDLSGKINLMELASWIAGADVLCSVDSVPVHLADAVQTPVVALFGPTDPKHWRPRFSRSEILRAPQMSGITPDEVTAAVGRILAGGSE